ncbi:hypothetical protein ACLB2K_070496 [Fragaria x ananassa]
MQNQKKRRRRSTRITECAEIRVKLRGGKKEEEEEESGVVTGISSRDGCVGFGSGEFNPKFGLGRWISGLIGLSGIHVLFFSAFPELKPEYSAETLITLPGFVTGALAVSPQSLRHHSRPRCYRFLKLSITMAFLNGQMYWHKFLGHKTKQRLTKMTQMRICMRKLALKTREKIMTTPRKEIKREARREEKAEKAAVLDKSIEKELLERLNNGVYGEIYNYPFEKYQKVLEEEDQNTEIEEGEIEYVADDQFEEEEEILKIWVV